MTRLGWIPIEGWWTWRLPGEDEPLRLAQVPEPWLGRRRLRHFEGVGGGVVKVPVDAYLATWLSFL